MGNSLADEIQSSQDRAYREGGRQGTIDNEPELNAIRERYAAGARQRADSLPAIGVLPGEPM